MRPRRDRLTRLALRPHVPRGTIRWRLTLVYGGLFLISGSALLAMTYGLVQHTTSGLATYRGAGGFSAVFSSGPPNARPSRPQQHGFQSDAGPLPAITPQQTEAQARQLQTLAVNQHADELHQLLVDSGLALAIMSVLSMGLGWLVAGRVLRPLRTISDAAHNISATNLHERLALTGPDDELKRLADTFDALLDRLSLAFDAQRHFVANASHELRTPLTLMRALLQMTLTDPHATIDSFRSTCDDVMAAGEHQERLIEALLVLASSERGLDHREPIDLSVIADDVALSPHPEIEAQGLQMTAEINPARIDGDARLVERLVANLVDNALRHNVQGGSVSLETGVHAGAPFLSVINTGPVVPPEEVGRLLAPFQRLGPESADSGTGLGLGLSIVRAIATAHDATLTVDAQPGGGLRIEVRFPAAATRHDEPARPSTALAPSA